MTKIRQGKQLHAPEVLIMFVSLAKNGRNIGVLTPLASSYVASHFGFRSITDEGMHKFHAKFTES